MVFPKWLYHKTEKPVIVKSEAEMKALGADWRESPADFHNEEIHKEKPKEKKAKTK
jgi:hypothetical protein